MVRTRNTYKILVMKPLCECPRRRLWRACISGSQIVEIRIV